MCVCVRVSVYILSSLFYYDVENTSSIYIFSLARSLSPSGRHPAEKKSQVIEHAMHSSSIFAMNLDEPVGGESECSIK